MSQADSPDGVTLTRKWQPHPGQQPIDDSDARFRVIACGRRFGKTDYAGHALFEHAFENPDSLCWWVAPTYPIAETGYLLLEEIIPEGFIEDIKRSKPREITLVNGAKIGFRTTAREDGLVSVGLDFLVIDEAAMVPSRAWKKELRPTLSDTLGEMIAISTPKGRNWFHEMFQRGQSPDYGQIDSWQKSTYENPHVPDSEVEAAKDELPERIFEQEYEAEFVDDSGGVFEKVRERAVEEYDCGDFDGEPEYQTGVDFARHQDHTVIITVDSESRVVAFERLRNGGEVAWPTIQAKIERRADEYPGPVRVDATRDNKIVADLEANGVRVDPVKFSPTKKTELIENLVTRIENEELTIPDIPQLIQELQIFEYDTTRAGNVRYHAPEGFTDDCVDALALAAMSGSPVAVFGSLEV